MTGSDESTRDEIFEVLSSSRRRQLLYHLHRRGGTAALGDLAEDVAAVEADEEIDENVVKRFYISLYQTHVPKLEEAGFVVYHEEEKRVELTDRVDEIRRILETDDDVDRPWPLYYGGLAAVGLVVVLLAAVGAGPGAPAVGVAAAGVAVGLLALALFHYYETRLTAEDGSFPANLVND
jgi:hypothetical protein